MNSYLDFPPPSETSTCPKEKDLLSKRGGWTLFLGAGPNASVPPPFSESFSSGLYPVFLFWFPSPVHEEIFPFRLRTRRYFKKKSVWLIKRVLSLDLSLSWRQDLPRLPTVPPSAITLLTVHAIGPLLTFRTSDLVFTRPGFSLRLRPPPDVFSVCTFWRG